MAVASISQFSGLNSSGLTGSHVGWSLRRHGLDGVASLLGMSTQQLKSDMTGGQSLVQILQANGKTADQGAQAFLSGIESRINADVASGKIPADQALTVLQHHVDHINREFGTSLPVPTALPASPTVPSGSGSVLDATA